MCQSLGRTLETVTNIDIAFAAPLLKINQTSRGLASSVAQQSAEFCFQCQLLSSTFLSPAVDMFKTTFPRQGEASKTQRHLDGPKG